MQSDTTHANTGQPLQLMIEHLTSKRESGVKSVKRLNKYNCRTLAVFISAKRINNPDHFKAAACKILEFWAE